MPTALVLAMILITIVLAGTLTTTITNVEIDSSFYRIPK
jgi:hypothetical protein